MAQIKGINPVIVPRIPYVPIEPWDWFKENGLEDKMGGPPPMGGPMAATLTLKWDGTSALWVNEMGQEVVLEDLKETADTLTFTAMAGPAPIEWTIRKEGVGFTAVSHRGADIHGNPPVDTTCKVSYQAL